MKTASDFTGQYVGSAATNTKAILQEAQGKVLVIDEAYNLDDNLYGKQALDVIVEQVHGADDEDIAVLLLGYDKQMRSMLRNQNPGLNRRFSPENAFNFEDYNTEELLKIFQKNCEEKGVGHTPEAAKRALQVLKKQMAAENFGNAGAVNTLVRDAVQRANQRHAGEGLDGNIVILPQDIGEETDEEEDPMLLLEGMRNVQGIRSKLMQMTRSMQVALREGDEDVKAGNFVFKGRPGTGSFSYIRSKQISKTYPSEILLDLSLNSFCVCREDDHRSHFRETSL